MKNKLTQNIVLLLIGSFFIFFSNGKYNFALAAWLFPIFILQISRNEKNIYALLVIPSLFGFAFLFSFWYTFNNPTSILFYIPALLGFFMGLLFYVDRLLYDRIDGFKATLILPILYTSFDFLSNLLNPLGTMGVLGYSQHEFLSFSQLASITGMWGLTFMITWFGSVVFWCIENYIKRNTIRKGITIYLSILIPILVFGGIRLAIPLDNKTVKVSGIHTHDKNEGEKILETLYRNDTINFKKMNNKIILDLTEKSQIEANSGAKIIIWSENSFLALKKDEDSLMNELKNFSKQNQIYLVVTPFIINSGSKSENKTLLLSPDGSIISTHYKYGGNFLEGTVDGNKKIKTVKTPYGNFTSIICWDGDFPSIVKQVGIENTDVLFIPASDWKEVNPLHATIAIYRGIENGCSVVRQTRNGLSFMTDPRGKIVTRMDHFETNSWIMSAQVPSKKLWTLYPIIGDLFGWLSIVVLLFFIFESLKKK